MEYSKAIDIIINDIKEVSGLVENFKKYEKISRIDIDLVLSKIRDLYDLLLLLDQSNTKIYKDEKKEVIETPKKDTGEKIVIDKTTDSDIHEKKTLADKFEESQESVNELIAKKSNKKNLSTKIQSTSITDIHSAIGINDKFLFIKELFDGDSEKYNAVLDMLNKIKSLEDAFSFLEKNFKLDEKNEIDKTFLELVRRKFKN